MLLICTNTCCSFEQGGATGAGILSQPHPPSTAVFSLTDYTIWCDKVYAAIDCYCWVFSNGYIAPCEVFGCEYHLVCVQLWICTFLDSLWNALDAEW